MWHHNVDLVAYHDLGGRSGFKLARWLAGPPNTMTIQVQVADGVMITALEHPPPGLTIGDPVDRSFDRFTRALVRALSGWSDVPEPGREVQA
jgi:hypothetical protein